MGTFLLGFARVPLMRPPLRTGQSGGFLPLRSLKTDKHAAVVTASMWERAVFLSTLSPGVSFGAKPLVWPLMTSTVHDHIDVAAPASSSVGSSR
jgi:hypothetical protein